ncbi:MAG: hypothetical protein R3181_08110 [Rubricoccaceae bacterium]|nr:hypothetical protein [Rubricoccaceae bacterium]
MPAPALAPSAPSTAPTDLAPPAPLDPLGGAVVDGAAPTFSWRGVPGAVRYLLQLAPDRQFARDVLELDAGPSTQLALLDALPPADGPLFWRVRAVTARGTTRWSPYGRFVPGTDDAAEAFRQQQEAARTEARREQIRREAEAAAARDLVPLCERDDTIPSDAEAGGIGIAMILSIVAVGLAVVLVTLMASV